MMFIELFVFSFFLHGNSVSYVDGIHCCSKLPILNNITTCASGNVSVSLSCEENKSKIDYYVPRNDDPFTSICNLTNYWICHHELLLNKEQLSFYAVIKCVDDKVQCERISTTAEYDEQLKTGYYEFYTILNLVSAFLLLCTSFLYFLLPQMNYTDGTCVRHYALVLALPHLYFATYRKFTPFSTTSIVYSYLFMYSVVSAFNWLNLLSYSTWRSTKGYSNHFDCQTLLKYYITGYVCPIVIVSFSFVVSYLRSFMDPSHIPHNRDSMVLNAVLMIPAVLSVNLYFFFDSLKWLSKSDQDCISTTNLQPIRYRVWLDFKLFLIALLWILFEINLFFPLVLNFGQCISILLSMEGILIFVVLVLLRKTVLRSLADIKYNGKLIFPSGWKTLRGPEYEETNHTNVNYINEDRK